MLLWRTNFSKSPTQSFNVFGYFSSSSQIIGHAISTGMFVYRLLKSTVNSIQPFGNFVDARVWTSDGLSCKIGFVLTPKLLKTLFIQRQWLTAPISLVSSTHVIGNSTKRLRFPVPEIQGHNFVHLSSSVIGGSCSSLRRLDIQQISRWPFVAQSTVSQCLRGRSNQPIFSRHPNLKFETARVASLMTPVLSDVPAMCGLEGIWVFSTYSDFSRAFLLLLPNKVVLMSSYRAKLVHICLESLCVHLI